MGARLESEDLGVVRREDVRSLLEQLTHRGGLAEDAVVELLGLELPARGVAGGQSDAMRGEREPRRRRSLLPRAGSRLGGPFRRGAVCGRAHRYWKVLLTMKPKKRPRTVLKYPRAVSLGSTLLIATAAARGGAGPGTEEGRRAHLSVPRAAGEGPDRTAARAPLRIVQAAGQGHLPAPGLPAARGG